MIDFENRGPLAAAGGGPATISWQSKYATNASTTSIDSGTIAIGDDTDPHHCIVAVYQRLNSIPRPTSVQVDGQSCSLEHYLISFANSKCCFVVVGIDLCQNQSLLSLI